jgi:hypothetical protein
LYDKSSELMPLFDSKLVSKMTVVMPPWSLLCTCIYMFICIVIYHFYWRWFWFAK